MAVKPGNLPKIKASGTFTTSNDLDHFTILTFDGLKKCYEYSFGIKIINDYLIIKSIKAQVLMTTFVYQVFV